MSLRIRRGTDAQRATTPLDMGELVYTTDTKQLYVGNGIDAGGSPIIRLGTGLAWADPACTTIIATGAALQVSADATPSLGGNLTLSGYNITGTGNINITGSVSASVAVKSSLYQGTTEASNIVLQSTSNSAVNVVTITDGGGNNPTVNLNTSRGTIASPTTNIAGDILGGYQVKGYGSGGYTIAVAMLARWSTGTVNFTSAYPASQLLLAVGANSSSPTLATFDGLTGVFTAPALATTVYSAAGTAIPSAVTMGQGARAFVSDATVATFATVYTGGGINKVPVYSDGTSWFIG